MNTFVQQIQTVALTNEGAIEALAKRAASAVNDRAAFMPVLALLAFPDPMVAARVVEVCHCAGIMTRANVIEALQRTLEQRPDLLKQTRRRIVEALIDTALNGDGVSQKALLTYVQMSSRAREDYQMVIALFPARLRKARELEAVNRASEKGGAS